MNKSHRRSSNKARPRSAHTGSLYEKEVDRTQADDLCLDLCRKFAGPAIDRGMIELRYSRIAIELRSAARYPTSNESTAAWLDTLESAIRKHLMQQNDSSIDLGATPVLDFGTIRQRTWKLLAHEWLRDAANLRRFLKAISARWRKHDDLNSSFVFKRAVMDLAQLHGHNQKAILARLQHADYGLAPSDAKLTERTRDSLLSKIRQLLSRDLNNPAASSPFAAAEDWPDLQ